MWPKEHGLRLCHTVANDAVLREQIIEIIRANQNIRITSYAATEEYLELLRLFQKEGVHFQMTNLPRIAEPIRLVQKVGSKNGIREIVDGLFPQQGIQLPVGYICKDKHEVVRAISAILSMNQGFVVKIHDGESGWGVEIMSGESLKSLDRADIDTWLAGLFETDQIWKSAPYVVEEFIQADTSVAGGFPSGEGCVTDAGYTYSYSCGQQVTERGEFEGISIGSSLPSLYEQRIKTALSVVGERLHACGYRGNFDIDFIAGADGNLYILECNARLTGGTHVYGAMSQMKVSSEQDIYVFSNDSLCYGGTTRSAEDILSTLSNLLYPIQGKTRGVLVSFISPASSVVGIIVIAKDEDDARSLTENVKQSLFQVAK